MTMQMLMEMVYQMVAIHVMLEIVTMTAFVMIWTSA